MLTRLLIALCLLCGSAAQSPGRNTTSAPQARFCGSPPVLLNARLTTTGETEGDVADYTCNDGFDASGTMQTICRGGLWVITGPSPTCRERYCASAPTVPNSSNNGRFGSRNPVGSVIRYNCYSGYRVNGTDQVVCQANRTWSSPKPVCSPKDCGPAPAIQYGTVDAASQYYPTSARYRCNTGYRLVNPNSFGNQNPASLSVSCLYTGRWGNIPSCQPVRCRSPSRIGFGYKLFGSSYLYDDVVVYGCNVGYSIRGNKTITCLETGRWSSLPQCTIVTCSNPPKVANSTVTSTPTVNYGNSSYYHCDEGFYMSGFSHVTCKADGTWTDPPTCTSVNCRSPPAILFGNSEWNSTTFKSKAKYVCDKGYTLIGVSEVTCLAHGSWDNTPSCQPAAPTVAQAQTQVVRGGADSPATIASLAVAVAVMGLITLFFLVFFAFKIYPHKSRLFSYASYKNGDETINSGI